MPLLVLKSVAVVKKVLPKSKLEILGKNSWKVTREECCWHGRKRCSVSMDINTCSIGTNKKFCKSNDFMCPICLDASIIEATKEKHQDAAYQQGICDTWLCSGCTSVSKVALQVISYSSFYCPLHVCHLHTHEEESTTLKASVLVLSTDIKNIENQLS